MSFFEHNRRENRFLYITYVIMKAVFRGSHNLYRKGEIFSMQLTFRIFATFFYVAVLTEILPPRVISS